MSSALADKIKDFIDEEVNKQVQNALSNYAEMISKSYKIPLSLLLRDIPSVSALPSSTKADGGSQVTTCLGLRAGNKRCKMNGKYEGYCRHHFKQKEKAQPIKIIQGEVRHNHGFPPMYQEGCPACSTTNVKKSVEPKKPLIDFKLAF
jgi:hypothetical protein